MNRLLRFVLVFVCLAGSAVAETDYPSKAEFRRLLRRVEAVEAGGLVVQAYTPAGDLVSLTNVDTLVFRPQGGISYRLEETSPGLASLSVSSAGTNAYVIPEGVLVATNYPNAGDVLYAAAESPTNLYWAPLPAESDPIWTAASGSYATGTPLYVESDPIWTAAGGSYATGTPLYVESDPVWLAQKSGYATGTPVYAESDPAWSSAKTDYVEFTNLLFAAAAMARTTAITNGLGHGTSITKYNVVSDLNNVTDASGGYINIARSGFYTIDVWVLTIGPEDAGYGVTVFSGDSPDPFAPMTILANPLVGYATPSGTSGMSGSWMGWVAGGKSLSLSVSSDYDFSSSNKISQIRFTVSPVALVP